MSPLRRRYLKQRAQMNLLQTGRTRTRGDRHDERPEGFRRVTVDPSQMGGVACVRGLRIPVATVIAMVADGMSEREILRSYPDRAAEDIREALRFASQAVRERELPIAPPAW